MAVTTRKSTKLSVLGFGALAFSVAAVTFGAGPASADPNDPSMTNARPDGTVSSRQAASTSGAKHCVVNPGTLGTSSVVSSDVGTPMQTAAEAGPSWVGSDGWQAIGLSPSSPWRGNFNQSTGTGPQCKKGKAGKGNSF